MGLLRTALEFGVYSVVSTVTLLPIDLLPGSGPRFWFASATLVALGLLLRIFRAGRCFPVAGGNLPPLLLPGLTFGAWGLFQLLVVPDRVAFSSVGAWSMVDAPERAMRNLAYIGSIVGLHWVSWETSLRPGGRSRQLRFVASLGLVLSAVGLAQEVLATRRIYGLIEGVPDSVFFGPFWYRNYFAAYMIMVVPVSLRVWEESRRAFWERVRHHDARPRRIALSFLGDEGIALVYASMAPISAIIGLVATRSRGGVTALVLAGLLAALRNPGRRPVRATLLAAITVAAALAGSSLLPTQDRFSRTAEDAWGRVLIWATTLREVEGRHWLTGYGLGTYEAHAPIFLAGVPEQDRPALHPLAARTAHSEYVQVLYESGLVGLLLVLWAGWAVLRVCHRDPWLLAGFGGVLLHAALDSDFRSIPVAVLFGMLAAVAGGATGSRQ